MYRVCASSGVAEVLEGFDVVMPGAVAGRVRRSRSRWRPVNVVLLSLAGAVALLLSGISGTSAYLMRSVNAPTGVSVTSATRDLRVNDAASANLGTLSLTPLTSVLLPFKLSNTGAVDFDLKLSMTATPAGALRDATQVRVNLVASSAACVRGLSGTPVAVQGYATAPGFGVLAAGASTWACVEVILPVGASGATTGSSIDMAMTAEGVQRPA